MQVGLLSSDNIHNMTMYSTIMAAIPGFAAEIRNVPIDFQSRKWFHRVTTEWVVFRKFPWLRFEWFDCYSLRRICSCLE